MQKPERYYRWPNGLFEASRRIDSKRVVFWVRTCEEVSAKIKEYRQRLENECLYGWEFPEIADEWMAEQERRLSQSTKNGYGIVLRRLKAAFPGYASQIRVWDIETNPAREVEKSKGLHK